MPPSTAIRIHPKRIGPVVSNYLSLSANQCALGGRLLEEIGINEEIMQNIITRNEYFGGRQFYALFVQQVTAGCTYYILFAVFLLRGRHFRR